MTLTDVRPRLSDNRQHNPQRGSSNYTIAKSRLTQKQHIDRVAGSLLIVTRFERQVCMYSWRRHDSLVSMDHTL